ncbi:hypothetical protein V6255_07445 [Psychromonas arctica]|uniref:Uncharacterized protein n=1 Tax=Psychromonas arctica TaxID=168275 RepID=A0ABU9HB69_9GAMM
MLVSKSYGNAYSFSSIDNKLDFDAVELEISNLKKVIGEFSNSKNNNIEFSTDYYDLSVSTQSLENNLLDITNDTSATIHLLSEIEKAIGPNKSYLDTPTMLAQVKANNLQGFLYEYPYTLKSTWPGIPESSLIYTYRDACNHNSFNFRNGLTTPKEFTDKAILTYEHIEFHEEFEDRLNTIKRGVFSDYLSEFSHALNTLNQAYFDISKDGNQNANDLIKIQNISRHKNLQGRELACTQQAKNKPFFNFPNLQIKNTRNLPNGTKVLEHPIESVNCEFHLKLNFNDQNIKLPDDYNRAYFGLKYCDITKRKYIKIAYIGEHWPPKKGGKKRK